MHSVRQTGSAHQSPTGYNVNSNENDPNNEGKGVKESMRERKRLKNCWWGSLCRYKEKYCPFDHVGDLKEGGQKWVPNRDVVQDRQSGHLAEDGSTTLLEPKQRVVGRKMNNDGACCQNVPCMKNSHITACVCVNNNRKNVGVDRECIRFLKKNA